MVPTEKIELVETNYLTSDSNYQQKGSGFEDRRYVSYSESKFSDYQTFMYKKALYGLDAYTTEEVKYMHWEKKKKIIKSHKKVQEILNLWKQDVVIKWTNSLFEKTFGNNKLVKELLESKELNEPIEDMQNTLSFKELMITKDQIISKLIAMKLLPLNFWDLVEDPNKSTKLPRLKCQSS